MLVFSYFSCAISIDSWTFWFNDPSIVSIFPRAFQIKSMYYFLRKEHYYFELGIFLKEILLRSETYDYSEDYDISRSDGRALKLIRLN